MDPDSALFKCLVGTETASHTNETEHDLDLCWCLSSISFLPQYLKSNVYSLSINCPVLWKVEAHFQKTSHGAKDGLILTIKLHRIDEIGSTLRGTVQIALSDSQNFSLYSGLYSAVFPESCISNPLVLSVTLWDSRVWSVADDDLTLFITLKSDQCCSGLNRITPTPNLRHQLVKDMKSALENHLLADVVFTSEEGPIIHANRFVLQMRSPCFNHLRPNENVLIQNMTGNNREAFTHFISYLYTGIVRDMSPDIACKLYVIALQYQANDLKESCSLMLISKLACDSVCEILKLAHEHKDVYMKEAAMRFASTHYSEVMFLPKWEKLIASDNLLHAEVTHYCAIQRTLRI